MSHLELSVREIVESAVIQALKDEVKLLIRRHPRAEPIFSGNLKINKYFTIKLQIPTFCHKKTVLQRAWHA